MLIFFFSLYVGMIIEKLFISLSSLSTLHSYSIEKVYIDEAFDLYSPKNSPNPPVDTTETYCFPLISYNIGGGEPTASISKDHTISPFKALSAYIKLSGVPSDEVTLSDARKFLEFITAVYESSKKIKILNFQ